MRRSTVIGLMAAVALVFIATGSAWAEGPEGRRSPGVSPMGAFCVTGPVFEHIRSVAPIDGVDALGSTKFTQDESLRGTYLTKVKFYYESQPAAPVSLTTMLGFPPEVVYMAEQFKPNRWNAWIRVDFSAMVSVTPATGDFAGVGYALYVKEDGGDGTIENPGVMACGGDDSCGYLEQTYDAPWLVATSNERSWVSVARSDFFRAQHRRKVEVQAHLFPMHEVGDAPGEVIVNFGVMSFSSGVGR